VLYALDQRVAVHPLLLEEAKDHHLECAWKKVASLDVAHGMAGLEVDGYGGEHPDLLKA
jgi:hypothetical protein